MLAECENNVLQMLRTPKPMLSRKALKEGSQDCITLLTADHKYYRYETKGKDSDMTFHSDVYELWSQAVYIPPYKFDATLQIPNSLHDIRFCHLDLVENAVILITSKNIHVVFYNQNPKRRMLHKYHYGIPNSLVVIHKIYHGDLDSSIAGSFTIAVGTALVISISWLVN